MAMRPQPHNQSISEKGQNKGLICRPLDTFSDIMWFMEQPPAWRILCKALTPHSKNKLKNMEIINRNSNAIRLETPDTFCHYDPDAEDVLRYDENTLPKTLVCHDMANGYHDDSYIEGTTNHAGYTFYNWAAVDIFCYFSHHFITIPPLSWINVAHEHGVKVIGTVITEWKEGVLRWDRILSSEAEATNFATKLVSIASTLKFDGWLLNVENKINNPDKLLNFLTTLHRLLHAELEHAVLIWYDSVTVDGDLNWQNGLNEENKAFFDVCDGIFTNYSWNQDDLQSSVAMARDRIQDLYIGVDVWGRNFFGGGHLNTQEAVAMIHHYGCSVSLFAPAWTHESLSMDPLDINGVSMAEGFDKFALFYLRDRALWGSLWPFLSTRVPCHLPFKSSFCRGMGQQRRMYGEVLCNGPWYNLRHQQYQPNSAHGPHGYLIYSFETLLKRVNDYKENPKGILRYRDSFQSESCIRNKESEDISCRSCEIFEQDEGSQHVHGPVIENDIKKPAEGSSDSDEDGNKKSPRSSSSASTLMQSVKKVISKIKKHKSFSELSRIFSPKQSQTLTPTSADIADQRLAENMERSSKVPKTCPDQSSDQSSALNQVDNKEDQRNTEEYVKNDVESLHSEAARRVANENNIDNELKLSGYMEAGPSTPKVARMAGGKSMQQVPVKIRLSTRQQRCAYGLSRVPGEMECLEFWLQDSFMGGACLRIHPSDEASPVHRHSRLFHCDFLCESALLVCVVTKPEPPSTQSLNILLKMKNVNSEPLTVVLIGRDMPQGKAQDAAAQGQLLVSPLDERAVAGMRTALLTDQSNCFVPLHNDFGWRVRYYHLTLPGCRVTSICCHALLKDGPILLGHLAIIPMG